MPKPVEIDISDDELERIATTLYTLEPPPKKTRALIDTIAKLETPIRSMLQGGFTYEQVSEILKDQFKVDDDISGSTLRRYLSIITKERLEKETLKVQKQIKRNRAKAKRQLNTSPDSESSVMSDLVEKPTIAQRAQQSKPIASQPQSFPGDSYEPPSEVMSQLANSVVPKQVANTGTSSTHSVVTTEDDDEFALFNKY